MRKLTLIAILLACKLAAIAQNKPLKIKELISFVISDTSTINKTMLKKAWLANKPVKEDNYTIIGWVVNRNDSINFVSVQHEPGYKNIVVYQFDQKESYLKLLQQLKSRKATKVRESKESGCNLLLYNDSAYGYRVSECEGLYNVIVYDKESFVKSLY